MTQSPTVSENGVSEFDMQPSSLDLPAREENILGRNTAFFENQERRTENFARSLCCPLVCRNVLLPQVFRMARSTYTESALLRSW